MNAIVKVVASLALLALELATTGCATIVTGRTQTISINSSPSGAVAHVGDQTIITPGSVTLDRNKNYFVQIEKDGYQSGTVEIRKGVNPWILGNIVFGGIGIIPGCIIDVLTGSAGKLSPNTLSLNLSPLKKSAMPGTLDGDMLSQAAFERRPNQLAGP